MAKSKTKFRTSDTAVTPIVNLSANNVFTMNSLGILDCEYCFQFDDNEPIVFATGSRNTKESFIQFKLTNNSSTNLEFTDNKHNKKFKLFARKKHES